MDTILSLKQSYNIIPGWLIWGFSSSLPSWFGQTTYEPREPMCMLLLDHPQSLMALMKSSSKTSKSSLPDFLLNLSILLHSSLKPHGCTKLFDTLKRVRLIVTALIIWLIVVLWLIAYSARQVISYNVVRAWWLTTSQLLVQWIEAPNIRLISFNSASNSFHSLLD